MEKINMKYIFGIFSLILILVILFYNNKVYTCLKENDYFEETCDNIIIKEGLSSSHAAHTTTHSSSHGSSKRKKGSSDTWLNYSPCVIS
jgi:hypothetical protein